MKWLKMTEMSIHFSKNLWASKSVVSKKRKEKGQDCNSRTIMVHKLSLKTLGACIHCGLLCMFAKSLSRGIVVENIQKFAYIFRLIFFSYHGTTSKTN